MTTDYSPEDALRDASETRARSAARIVTPWWYHPTLGLALAGIIASQAVVTNNLVMAAILLVAVTTLGLLVGAYRSRYGIWVSPKDVHNKAKAAWVTYAVLIAVLYGAALWDKFAHAPTWVGWFLTAAAFVVTVVLGPLMDHFARTDHRTTVTDLS